MRPHQHVIANPRGVAGRASDYRVFHHDAVRADFHRAALGREHGAEQDPAVPSDGDVAANHGVGCDGGGGIDARGLSLVFDQHHFLS